MSMKNSVWLLAGILALAACNNETSGGENNASVEASTVSASSVSVETRITELKSKDGALIIKTSGVFTDKSGDEVLQPNGVEAEQLTLLQHNEVDNVTVYAADLGKAKLKAEEYFAKLKKALEDDKQLKDVQVGEASANRMDYSFNQVDKNGDLALNESCAALVANEHVYAVCASSPEVSIDALSGVVRDISINMSEEDAAAMANSASDSASEVAASSAS